MGTLTFILSIFLPILAMFVVFYHVFPSLAEHAQVFDDLIIENVSSAGYNKSAELMLFRILAIACLVLTFLLIFLFSHVAKRRNIGNVLSGRFASSGTDTDSQKLLTAAMIAILPFIGHLLVFGKVSLACILGICAVLAVFPICKIGHSAPLPFLALPVLSYYAVLAVLTVLVQFSPVFSLSQHRIFLLTGIVTLLLFVCTKGRGTFCKKLLLLLQCIVPLLLMLFFVDRYVYHGNILRIRYAPFYYIFFLVLVVTFVAFSILHAKKHWGRTESLSLGRLLHPVTAITVFIYNSYSACPMYAQPDQHHHGEQMIPWQQIVMLGQTAYDEYTPVSGLFPMVNGFIQNLLLGGTVSDYSPAISMTVVLFCIITMYLIYRHVGGSYSLLFAIFFALPAYNRQYMVLPVLLLLFLKDLLQRPQRWLPTWIFSCFLAGLYYPLYGAAVLVATLPLGISMLVRFIKETDWKNEIRTPAFYISWIVCLLPILLCLPLLLRMVSHTLVYSGQTILADGISLYGQAVPEFFLPYLADTHENIRLWLYYGFRFFLPILPLVLALGLGALVWLLYQKHANNAKKVCLFGFWATILTLAVSYTYTLVRADTNMVLSRTAPVLIAVAGIFLPVLLLSHGKALVSPSIRILILGIGFSLPMIIYHQVSAMKFPDMWIYPNGTASLVMDDADKLFSNYEVPESFISMQEISLPDTSMLGDGFMVADQVHYLQEYAAVMEKCNKIVPDISYLGMDGQGFYYYLNAKACATGFIQAGKGHEAQQRIWQQIEKARPVVFCLDAQASYFIFSRILTGDYCYCADDRAFYPVELYQMLYPEKEKGDDYRLVCDSTNLGLSPASFGASLSSLNNRLTIANPQASDVGDDFMVKGSSCDVLFLQLEESLVSQSASVQITFLSDGQIFNGASVSCLTGDGSLLIPMGMNACWLLGNNSQIMLHFYDEAGNQICELPLTDAAAHGTDVTFYHWN